MMGGYNFHLEEIMPNKCMMVLVAVMVLSALSCNPDTGSNSDNDGDYGDLYAEMGYPKPDKYIAISFDDGPSGAKTLELLKILKDNKVTASFFLIGQNIRGNKASAKAIFDDGHELCNHSDGYAGLGGATAEDAIRTSLLAASAAIKDITGKDPVYFRAPEVKYGDNLTAVCTELDMAIIGVSVWSHDYQSITAEQVKNNVLNAAKDGGIINCHDPNTSGTKTLEALPGIIDGLRKKGYWIMTVGQLAAKKGRTLEAGVRYDEIK
jgi:peptidoglycan/xylan/chitin deacetylase (PgdA/CDA1 family)